VTICTIEPGVPFLDALAAWWLGRSDDPLECANGLFLLPTRRAARALTEAFLRAADGRPLLLPRISAVGALDEAPLALAGALDVAQAVDEEERLAALTRLVLGLRGRHGAPTTADRAWLLAAELARLLDEAHREGVDLGRALPGLVGDEYAAHWADTLTFLQIVTAHWPAWLADQGKIDAADRAVRLLTAQAMAWEAAPPPYPVVVAGVSGAIRAVAGLMRVVARLPEGCVVLPGLDLAMDEDVWDALDDGHPQAGLRGVLHAMGAARGDVAAWPPMGTAMLPTDEGGGSAGRAELLRRALMPARALGVWRQPFAPDVAGLERLEAADQQEEAVAVALVLREALEAPGVRAALVTPDRALAGRVAAELARFGVVVDDSAGEPLAETPPGAFLRLVAEAVADGLAPVALLAVLKHPLAGLGLSPVECRRLARRLERRVLRGPAPPPGIAGLRAVLALHPDEALSGFIDAIETRLAPLSALAAGGDAPPAAALLALIGAAEALAETQAGPGALWALEEGAALSEHLVRLAAALPMVPPQRVRTLPGLLEASLQGAAVRSRRALRGRAGFEHPRIAILGLLEARLQAFDVLVLGGLAEGVWPPAADPGPWMSRLMRKEAGLASPEVAVGQMAHDFAMLACAAPRVVLSCPRRRDGAPTVPARWLVRLEAFLKGHGAALPHSPAAVWARLLDQPDGPPQPVAAPAPRPPVAARPRALSVTEVETWLRDPYGLYAKHVLRLRALDPLEQAVENSDFGSLVHAAIATWVRGLPATYPTDAARRLRAEMERELTSRPLRPALVAWWRPRLARIADWVAEEEAARQRDGRTLVSVEVDGVWLLPEVGFTLRGRADRIERRADGRLALLDYKTGVVPKGADVAAGYAAQLPLEAAMAEAGGFGSALQGTAAELTYWRLTGGYIPGEATPVCKGDPALVATETRAAAASLERLVVQFDDPAQAYLSQPHPGAAPRFTDYAQLARVAEWSAVEEAGE
jgi:ATP-dependent helicase/nuclease subunit B